VAETRGWRDAIMVYLQFPVLTMFFLGFTAGVPIVMVFGTLSAWFREEGVSLEMIGFSSTVLMVYALKVIWSPFVDHIHIPFLTRFLGQRRSWMLTCQIAIALGLSLLAFNDHKTAFWLSYCLALFVAFCSATQDVALDAFRVESGTDETQTALTASYVFGYRIGMLIAGGLGAFYIAHFFSWPIAYLSMAALMSVGMITVLIVPEPKATQDRPNPLEDAKSRALLTKLYRAIPDRIGRRLTRIYEAIPDCICRILAWTYGAVIYPFIDFFIRNGVLLALLILAFVGVYRLSDITLGIMANSFYIDLGFTKEQIADVAKFYGLIMTVVGGFVGGLLVPRFGIKPILLLGAIMVVATNLLFVLLARAGNDIEMLAIVISADNLSGGLATTAFLAYLASLTNQAYTATQYALFSSLMNLPAKFIGAFAGTVAETHGYEVFFFYAATLGVPSILLVLLLISFEKKLLKRANQSSETSP